MKIQISLFNKWLSCSFIFFAALSSSVYSDDLPDLEDMKQDFVLETRQIHIPDCPDAFNPSIIRWNGKFLMCYRVGSYELASCDPDDEETLSLLRIPKNRSTNDIGLAVLDDNFRVVGSPQILDIPTNHYLSGIPQQDPRLVTVDGDLYIVYSNKLYIPMIGQIPRIFFAKVHFDGKEFYADEAVCLVHYETTNEKRWEKNWSPFDYEGNLMFEYSLQPHKVFQYVPGTSRCETVGSSKGSMKWTWGALRGGSPALFVDNQYLAFFHSSIEMKSVHSKGQKISHYFMGAYTFSSKPPFSITSISPSPIVGKGFYHGKEHPTWKPLHVVFPCGFVFDDNYIWVSYGRQDHEIWIAKLDRQKLMQSLIPVTCVKE